MRLRILFAFLFAFPALAATVTGTVRSNENAALQGMTVVAYDTSGIARANATTDVSGHYTLTVNAGSYRVLAYDANGNFATSFFDNAESFDTSTVVNVQTSFTANFTLARAG
ncbi:MAG TPA: carboxypeptidase-like regulatory domain-containing protein, partial [Thermoanaerobaculia bacterium]|nr:carboxypeptidase-like regulatory domain-containing protein [Thermoanaerobaculia bacterium]